MFWCLPPSGKCEWANLRRFAEQFNDTFGTRYRLAKCLDISDSSKPQPEVLLESCGDKSMVIERKAIVWPPNYLKFHRSEHEFSDYFVPKVNSSFQDDVYALEIDASALRGNKAYLQALADQIANIVLANQAEIKHAQDIRSSHPIDWRFYRVDEFERDVDTPEKGVGVNYREPSVLPEQINEDYLKACNGVSEGLEELLSKASLKFANYPDCIRVLVLEVYGDEFSLDEDDIEAIAKDVELPSNVDQIWLAVPDWTSDSHFEVAYHQIRASSSN